MSTVKSLWSVTLRYFGNITQKEQIESNYWFQQTKMIMISPGFLDNNEISKCSHLREHWDALMFVYSEHFLISDCHKQGNLENQPPLGYSSLWLTRVLRGLSSLVSEHLSFIYPSAQTLVLADSQLLGPLPRCVLSRGKLYVSDPVPTPTLSDYLKESSVVLQLPYFYK